MVNKVFFQTWGATAFVIKEFIGRQERWRLAGIAARPRFLERREKALEQHCLENSERIGGV
jgi:hypothetical protein